MICRKRLEKDAWLDPVAASWHTVVDMRRNQDAGWAATESTTLPTSSGSRERMVVPIPSVSIPATSGGTIGIKPRDMQTATEP